MDDPWQHQLRALGSYIRTQRQLANLSLREVAALAQLSNAYISQLERGLHEPSIRVVRALAQALGVPPDDLLEAAGLLEQDPDGERQSTEDAIRSDPALYHTQKEALIAVYRSYRSGDERRDS
jgi:transcriptional regulator with XRE-family HTH domain